MRESDHVRRRSERRSLTSFLALWLLAARALPAAADDAAALRVLFVGNSLTFTHDLPQIVERLSIAAGDQRPVTTGMIARGGETFYRHSERRDEGGPLAVLARGGWDVVVLQENGRVAASSASDSFTFAARLVRAVRQAGAQPLFFMTWAYRDRPADHARIRETFNRLGARLAVPLAPVGEAWHLARQAAPGIELFADDGVHPSPAGTYLAASVIYASLTGRSPVGVPLVLPDGAPVIDLDAGDARRLQEIAWRAFKLPRRINHRRSAAGVDGLRAASR